MPGTTMTFSSRQAWKKLSPSETEFISFIPGEWDFAAGVEGELTGVWETLEVEPEVEGGVGDGVYVETHGAETLDDVVALGFEVGLEGFHLGEDFAGFEHGDCCFSVIYRSALGRKCGGNGASLRALNWASNCIAGPVLLSRDAKETWRAVWWSTY